MAKMTKTESVAVGFVVGILCPLLLFALCWWITAMLVIYHVLHIPEIGIAVAAFTGLALGITLDVLYLRRWIPRFYSVDVRVMMLVYLCCSVIGVAFFMGLPGGNVVLGTLAGIYVGRREYHAVGRGESVSKTIRRASLFTAIVTGAEALPIGLLALNEDWVVEWLQRVTGMEAEAVTGLFGIGLVVVLCAVLMAVQFWCTKTMAWIAFGYGRVEG
ncbi:MAG: hypothetical protein SXV54_16430, partial [Chloroflexota bacterium]|nr:hypothetical protein [Chloroflexota bacterium]